MKKLLLLLSFSSIVSLSCQQNHTNSIPNKKHVEDSIAKEKKKVDSIAVANVQIKKVVTVSDKTITVLKKPSIKNKVEFEFSSYGTLRQVLPERQQGFVVCKIKLSSKSKLNGKVEGFLPSLNVFKVNTDNSLVYLDALDYNFHKTGNIDVSYIEQIFDYKESETFICWIPIDLPIKKKMIISVSAKGKAFNKDNVIGVIEN